MERISKILLPLIAICLTGCGGDNESKSTKTVEENSSESVPISSTCEVSSEIESTSSEEIDYGKVNFSNIQVIQNFDGVRIEPIFTNPVACKNEKFTYTLSTDEFVEIDEDDKVWYIANGSTTVTAVSEHFNAKFFITSSTNFSNANFATSAGRKTATRLNADPDGTLCMGDSFFEFWANKTGITKSFSQTFAGYQMYNIGISATQTVHWRAFVENVVLGFEPKNIIVNIGINDVDDAGCMGSEAGRNVLSLLLDLHYGLPEANIYWTTLTQCSGVFASKWSQHSMCNSYVKNMAQYYDFLHILDLSEAYGADYAKYEQDGLHPNQSGYDLWENLILENVDLD